MARKPLADRFKRTLTQVGGQSLSITIPIEYLEELDWKKGDEVLVKLNKSRGRLTVERVVKEE